MSVLFDHLLQLQQKQQLLLKQFAVLKTENRQLTKRLAKKDAQLINAEEKLKDLQQKLDVLKISKGAFSDEEKKELERRIDAYVKEIDRCLALLNT